MPTTTYPQPNPGIAMFEEIGTYTDKFLLVSAEPEMKTHNFPAAASQTIARFQPVGLDSSNRLVPMTSGGSMTPLGILMNNVATDSGETTSEYAVAYSGHFNMDALVWDSSYDTDDKKRFAFKTAASVTSIVIGKR